MAAACSGLHQIFETTIPDSALFIDSFSPWKNQNKPVTSGHPLGHSFTEVFGELNFQEPPPFSSSETITPASASLLPSLVTTDSNQETKIESSAEKEIEDSAPESSFLERNGYVGRHSSSDSFSSMNSESLQLCTEGLGFESFDDVEDLKSETSCGNNNWDKSISMERAATGLEVTRGSFDQHKKSKRFMREFPPPISGIGRGGKPWAWFESYRKDGRFVLRQVRIPAQEFLHACREDGRLRLCLVQPGDCFFPEEEDDVADDDDDEGEAVVKEDEGQGGDLEDVKEEE